MPKSTLALFVLPFAIASSPATAGDGARAAKHLSADQAIACIKLAVAARAGNISELEVKVDNNRTICEVEIRDAAGKKFEVYVDVAANKVTRLED